MDAVRMAGVYDVTGKRTAQSWDVRAGEDRVFRVLDWTTRLGRLGEASLPKNACAGFPPFDGRRGRLDDGAMEMNSTKGDNMARFETPNALKNDARTLADDARALLDATADVTDQKVTEARQRLNEALTAGKEAVARAQEKASQGMQAADQAIRSHPYQSVAVAFGLGALVGLLMTRRD